MTTQEQEIKVGKKALVLANSIMPFIMHPPAANYFDETRDNIAKGLQKAMETYWPDMRDERDKANALNADTLQLIRDLVDAMDMAEIPPVNNDLYKRACEILKAGKV